MKGRYVFQVRFHDSIQIKGHVLQGINRDKHEKFLSGPIELWPTGVHFIFDGTEMFIPYANTPFMELVKENG